MSATKRMWSEVFDYSDDPQWDFDPDPEDFAEPAQEAQPQSEETPF